jgi:hypothetical protein
MTSYSPIANSEIDTESPITESLMVRVRDNPLAIQEGDPTAPRIQTPAYADKSVLAEKIGDATITTLQVAAETLKGGLGGNVALSTVTPDNMNLLSGTSGTGGFVQLAAGFVINWQRVPVTAFDDSVTMTWDYPYTSVVYFVIAGSEVPTAGAQADNTLHVVSSASLTQVTVRNEGFAGGQTISMGGYVVALGV